MTEGTEETEVCRKCLTEKPLSEFYVREGKPFRKCKVCERKAQKEHYHNRRIADLRFHIDRIFDLKRPQRFNAAIALYERKTITKGQLRTLLKNIQF